MTVRLRHILIGAFGRVLFTITSAGPIAAVVAFSMTKGLIYSIVDGVPHYANDLMSSGSDDQIAVSMGGLLFAFPLLISLARILAPISKFELVVFSFVLGLAIWLLAFGLDAGSISLTIMSGNLPLAGYVAALAWSAVYCVLMWGAVYSGTRIEKGD